MKNEKQISLLFFVMVILLVACRKEKDSISSVPIRGNVRNDCTGKGFPNVKVIFFTGYEGGYSVITTLTDADGNFSFPIQSIHSSSDYTYGLEVDSYTTFTYEFDAPGAVVIDKSNLGIFHHITAGATFDKLFLRLPHGVSVTPPDTFNVYMVQKIMQYYEPNSVVNTLSLPANIFRIGGYTYLYGYSMGTWQITLNKTKGGINTITTDSIYIGMGDTASYIVPY